MMQGPILVTGGTGTLGRVLVDRLRATGTDPRVLSRHPGPGRIVGDLATGAGIDDAVRGATVIVHCATSRRGDTATTRALLDAARRGGAHPHLIYVSIVGVDCVPLGYYRQKLAVERLVEAAGLPWTIQRATQFHDLLARLFATMARSPVLLALAATSFQPVDVHDVADRLVQLVAGAPAGRATDLGGPQVRPMTDLAHAWLTATGRRRAVVPVYLPGSVARGYRSGGHLTPDHAEGRITFEQYLANRPARDRS
jgi:uncharacterized protein YbjT (DUF2867 family)